MSWESIGEVDTGDSLNDADWIYFCENLALDYINLVCYEIPPGVKVGIMSHDHELGTYTTLGVYSEFDSPWEFIRDCEEALEVFNSAVSWEKLKEHFEDKLFAEDEDDDDEFEEEDEEDLS